MKQFELDEWKEAGEFIGYLNQIGLVSTLDYRVVMTDKHNPVTLIGKANETLAIDPKMYEEFVAFKAMLRITRNNDYDTDAINGG
jgi:hypothetical protein